MGKSKCKHENCNALEYRTSGYCLKHKKAAPESIFIVTSKLDEEGNQIQKNNHQSSDNVVNNKSDYSSKQIVLPLKPSSGNATAGILGISGFCFLILVINIDEILFGDGEIFCLICFGGLFTIIFILLNYSNAKSKYDNAREKVVMEKLETTKSEQRIPKKPSVALSFLNGLFLILAIIFIFNDDMIFISFLFGTLFLVTFVAISSANREWQKFIDNHL